MQGMVSAKEALVIKMLSKESLRKEFALNPEKYYNTKLFEEEGFERHKCRICGKYFWTADPERSLCGDSEHEGYSFIKEKPEDVSLESFWFKFAKFFEEEGHEIIEKYPVVSRWRQDLYFTIASIQDFQRIENGIMSFEYSANPLLVPQVCLRFNDIPNTGITGRHMTSFIMAGQTAFNYPKEGYWRDRTIELNYKALTKIVGVKKKDLTYIEDVWAMGDFSEYGPSLESFAGGLEMVNSVFTQFEYSKGKASELSGKVVDVGWGLERLIWFKSGAQTAYDPVFKNALAYIYKQSGIKPDHKLYSKISGQLGKIDLSESKSFDYAELELVKAAGISIEDYNSIIKPMQAAYAISDHVRTLLFAFNDGALPSNVGGGYNLRVLLRRIFDFQERYNIDIEIEKLLEIYSEDMKNMYKGLGSGIAEMQKIIDVERERYKNTKATASKIVNALLEKKEHLTMEKMKTLYESNGITPEFINSMASRKGIAIDIPESSYAGLIKGDFASKEPKSRREEIDTEGLKKTEKLFYDFATSSDSEVILVKKNIAVLDKTPFYAESGGQEADHGFIDGIKVNDVQSENGVILHYLEKEPNFKKGSKVHCEIDVPRRLQLMAHHTATHLISAASRKVLGNHAWQEGAKKSAEKAHIDIAHYERLSKEQIQKIEETANSYLQNGIKVTMKEMDRSEAESKFGFSIYQGHGVPASRLRIVEIRDLKNGLVDAEACGGIHAMGLESIIGTIKIINSSRIHDGIDRLEYVAGNASYRYINSMQRKLEGIAAIAGSDTDKVVESVENMSKQSEYYKKEAEKAKASAAEGIADKLAESKEPKIIKKLEYDAEMLRNIATIVVGINPKAVVMLYNNSRDVVCIAGADSEEDANAFIAGNLKHASAKEFKGGGTKRIAQGKLIA